MDLRQKFLFLFDISYTAFAQDAYDAANLAQEDLNGTARYVGMGGALDALGAEKTDNPAVYSLMGMSMKTDAQPENDTEEKPEEDNEKSDKKSDEEKTDDKSKETEKI